MKKIIALGMLVIMSLGILTACVDYGYEYHFNVVGENGSISAQSGERIAGEDASPLIFLGGKNTKGADRGVHKLEFIATPDSGFRVKLWTYNGEIVEGNKSNFFTIMSVKPNQYIFTITVEFEPIS